MPDDLMRFKAGDELFATAEMDRQNNLKLVAQHFDPFADIYRELGVKTTNSDAKHAPNQKLAEYDMSSEANMTFTEGMQFDFF